MSAGSRPHEVEWRIQFILVFTPDTFYDNDSDFPTHLALGQQESVEEQSARSRIKLSRDDVLGTCAKTTGTFSGSPGAILRLLTLPPGVNPNPQGCRKSSQVTAT